MITLFDREDYYTDGNGTTGTYEELLKWGIKEEDIFLDDVYNGWSDFDEYLDINGGMEDE